jgi:hypothetical protein
MPMWRCPHCGTPQPETSRCWVCRRSSTTCSTCRHFRQSLAAQVGFCGLDPRRAPLRGNEHRGCWEERVPTAVAPQPARASTRDQPAAPSGSRAGAASGGPKPRLDVLEGFVPVQLRDAIADAAAASPTPLSAVRPAPPSAASPAPPSAALGELTRRDSATLPRDVAALAPDSPRRPVDAPAPGSETPEPWTTRFTLFGDASR